MALRIEKAFGVSMDTRMQNSYDIARMQKIEKQIKVKAFVPKAVVG